ncbi:hypothetical protein C5C07_17430 [Haloferax sp. Atlit-4N]|uniref:fumarylacetoacetate hydrolase family protein n=1 Tax=Haloferax sp. Atlit-4N TaxID=2077206 RepID=UPI000E2690BB|nr:fumarylacetoacetate hydrolase family protein [Haloferax sp. Atlit-4N]RDZ51360.1 hypothetical protein C5C07_17430 [Haloferax sp. Atlit-4N]
MSRPVCSSSERRFAVRGDSSWDVPEPELGIVLHRGEVVGYTIGNDVSSRDIEGKNPRYLPQSKVYDRCCSTGPCVSTPNSSKTRTTSQCHSPSSVTGKSSNGVSTSTSEMATSCEKLVDYLCQHNNLPETLVLLTGTALVPPETFTLKEGDRVAIDIDNIGQLVNDTVVV